MKSALPLFVAFVCSSTQGFAAPAPILGSAGSFAILAGSTVTNTGPSVILTGNLGVSPGSAVTGFPPGIVNAPGVIHAGDAVAATAQSDLTTAYNALAGLAPTSILTGTDLGGLTLTSGVYFFASSAQLTGTLTLDAMGDPNAFWVFQIGSTLTTASNSSVVNAGSNALYWQVGSSATLGTDTSFSGNIVALTSITMTTGADIGCGSALAQNGAVTLDTNTISTGCQGLLLDGGVVTVGGGGVIGAVPEPETYAMLLAGLGVLGFAARRRQKKEKDAAA
jgi:type VI secretion system secreted protein VgrG